MRFFCKLIFVSLLSFCHFTFGQVQATSVENVQGAQKQLKPLDKTHLLPLSAFELAELSTDLSSSQESALKIDARRFDLAPLDTFTFAKSLTIDTRVSNLRVLASFQQYSLDARVSQLTPLSAFQLTSSTPIADSPANDVEIDLPPLAPVETGPTIYLRDIQTAWVSELLFDDNVYADQQGGQGSWLSTNNLNTSVTLQRRQNTYLASFGLIHREFENKDVQSQTDQRMYLNAVQELGRRNSVSLGWQWDEAEEARGTGLLEGVDDVSIDSLTAERNRFTLEHKLGDKQSRMSIKTTLHSFTQRYQKLEGITDVNNYDTLGLDSSLSFKTGPNTRWFTNLNWTQTDHLDDDLSDLGLLSSLDATSQLIQFGVDRQIAKHSSLKVQLGSYRRQFKADRADENTEVWSMEFGWNPRTYSRFSFSHGRRFLPSRGNGSFIDSTENQMRWLHEWTPKVKTQLSVGFFDDKFVDSGRRDYRHQYSLTSTYAFSENWRVVLGYRQSDKQSNIDSFNFDKSVWFVRSSLRF